MGSSSEAGGKRSIKRAIRRVLLELGIDVRRASRFGGRGTFEDQRRLLESSASDLGELTIVDAGAHVGKVTARYREMFPEARIHSFEPAAPAFEQLEKRFADDDGTFVYQTALSDERGSARLCVNRDDVTNSLLASSSSVSDRDLADRMTTLEQVEVPSTTLDEWSDDQGVDQIHILKMDVQGAELAVLRGAERKLSSQDVWLVYSEVSFAPMYEGQAFFWDVAGCLAGHGFELFNLYNCKTGARGQLTWGDAIFLGSRLLGPVG